MQQQLNELLNDARASIGTASQLQDLEQLRVRYLGKKGQLTDILKNVSALPITERPEAGKLVNQAKREVQSQIEAQLQKLNQQALKEKLQSGEIDVTLPGRGQRLGARHPVMRVQERVVTYFDHLGYAVAEGPEIEDDYHNFEALNIPPYHPARATFDTFYFNDGKVLRTHTSPVQIRVMENQKPPLRVITPGRVYRRHSDLTHTPMFHQLEGLVVDKNVSFSNLKACLQDFMATFFERENLKLRFRPSYFPFTEPSAEVDIQHLQCQGKGCRVCGFSGWLEVLGCGMVHPNVLRQVHIDPDEYSGFAFGIGLDRLAMLYYGIDDLRTMFENDVRFLKQF